LLLPDDEDISSKMYSENSLFTREAILTNVDCTAAIAAPAGGCQVNAG